MEAKGLSVRGFLWFSAADLSSIIPGTNTASLPNCQTPGAAFSMHRANMPQCDLLHLPGWTPAEDSYRYLQKRTTGKISTGGFHLCLQVWRLCLATVGRELCGELQRLLMDSFPYYHPLSSHSYDLPVVKAFRPTEYQTCANLCSL